MAEDYIVVYITVPNEDIGLKLSRGLVEARLAACVNLLGDLRSVYWWRGNIEEAKEKLLVVKSRRDKFEELVRFVKMNHPYEVPEIIAIPIISGNSEYMRWIDEAVGAGNA